MRRTDRQQDQLRDVHIVCPYNQVIVTVTIIIHRQR